MGVCATKKASGVCANSVGIAVRWTRKVAGIVVPVAVGFSGVEEANAVCGGSVGATDICLGPKNGITALTINPTANKATTAPIA